ncbi:MAG: hypothetical protein KDC82_00725, partial [Bacteroidetes bacterium]|nr:hypothetical protein [Bacteroidota bacterium]
MVDSRIIDTIKNIQIGEFSEESLEALKLDQLLQEFPCFQSAYLLKAIYLKQKNEMDFQEELPEIAVRVQNRSVLYDRVHFPYQVNEKRAKSAQAQAQNLEESLEEQNLDQELEDILDLAENIKEEELHPDTTVQDKSKNQSLIEEIEDLEKPGETHAAEEEDLKKLVDSIRRTQKSKGSTTRKKAPSPEQDLPDSKFSWNAYPDAVPSKLSPFNQWLLKKKQLNAPQKIATSKESLEELTFDMQASNEAELLLEVQRSSFKLEDFIVGQIEKKQSKKSMSKPSFRHAISETYAKILEEQDKFQEAIDVYKELSIK